MIPSRRKLISIVSACYNEEQTVAELHARIQKLFTVIPELDYELIFVDDASQDNSAQEFAKLLKDDPRVYVVQLSRNFGNPQYCYLAGMTIAKGDAVVFIDADLQHPPELIAQFIEKWQQGFKVVYGIRKRCEEGFVRKAGYYLFYRLFSFLCSFNIPKDAGDFGLMDRRVVDIILALPEKDMFLRGLRAWVGFKQIGIEHVQLSRKKGQTKFSFFDYIRTAKDAFINFSARPLELISFMAMACAAVTALASCAFLFLAFTTEAPRGFFTLILTILFFGTIQLAALGVLAEYMIRVFREVKQRPSFIIEKVLSHKKDTGETNYE
jgi:dolichol-phosphate mannosyltransferase